MQVEATLSFPVSFLSNLSGSSVDVDQHKQRKSIRKKGKNLVSFFLLVSPTTFEQHRSAHHWRASCRKEIWCSVHSKTLALLHSLPFRPALSDMMVAVVVVVGKWFGRDFHFAFINARHRTSATLLLNLSLLKLLWCERTMFSGRALTRASRVSMWLHSNDCLFFFVPNLLAAFEYSHRCALIIEKLQKHFPGTGQITLWC